MYRSSNLCTTALLLLLTSSLFGCAGMGQHQGTFEEMAYPELQNGPDLTAEQHERMGDDLHEQNSPEMAFVHYTRALASVGSDEHKGATLQVKKGLVLFSQGHDEAALKIFQTVLADRPDHPLANEAAGAVYLKAGLSREARVHFEHAAALDPNLWRTQQYLGMLASREGRHADAVGYFTTSLELRPDQPGTLNNLGVAHLMNSDYDDALMAFRRALATGAPQNKTYNNIGLTLARMGRTQEALQTFRFGGDDAKAHNNLGYVLMLQGDNALAIRHFEQAIELSPNYYAKAFSNLKQARLALSFQQASPEVHAPAGYDHSPDISQAPIQSSVLPPDASLVVDQQPRIQATPVFLHQPEPVLGLGYVPFQNASVTPTLPLSLTGPMQQPVAPPHVTEAKPLPENASQNHGRYGLHVASFKNQQRTARYVTELATKGIETMVMNVDIDGTHWHRVLAGRFETSAAAAAARPTLLHTLGLDNAPIKKFAGSGSLLPPTADGFRSL